MNDAPLHDLFNRARGLDAAGVPVFDALLARRRARDLAGPCLTLLLLALIAFTTFSVSEPPPPYISLSEWRSPTAFLLHTTDEALWRDLPSLGPVTHFSPPDKEIP